MIIYKNTFENIKTLKSNFPIEDQFYANENIAVVADGITRDPIGVFNLSQFSFKEMIKRYPRPSGAEMAAKTIVETFEKPLSSLKETLIMANAKVKELNDRYIKKCDYLENDYYGAVASSAWIKGRLLEYAYICDSGIIIYDRNGRVKFQTDDDKTLNSDPYIGKVGIPWYMPEARVIIRRDFRNNPNNIKDGKCVSYGAITGEETAIPFIKNGGIVISDTDIIVVYTDGFNNYLRLEKFINLILNFNEKEFEKYIAEKSQADYERFGKEKTLVIMKNVC